MAVEVTFVIPTFGNLSNTTRCLESLRSWFPDEPVVLVDDGSPEEADTFGFCRLQAQHNLVLLRKPNEGKSIAINTGARLVRTDYLVFCDNDVVFHGRDWLGEHLALLATDPRIGGIGGYGNPDFLDENGFLYHEAEFWSEPGYCQMVNGGLVTTRTATALAIPHDEEFSFAFEDFAWGCQLTERGLVHYLSAAQADHCMRTNVLPEHHIEIRDSWRPRFVERYAHVLSPRRERSAVRHFMRHGVWPDGVV